MSALCRSATMVEPSYENCVSGEYPLARFLLVYVNKKPVTPLDPLTSKRRLCA